jgi:hypothetical protein
MMTCLLRSDVTLQFPLVEEYGFQWFLELYPFYGDCDAKGFFQTQ